LRSLRPADPRGVPRLRRSLLASRSQIPAAPV
jgi:hypothetical protein